MRRARVTAVYPSEQKCDLVFLDDGWTVGGVDILAGLSSDGLDWGVPSVPKPSTQANAPGVEFGRRMLIASCLVCNGRPVVIGFSRSHALALAVTQDDRKLYVHPSTGAYYTFAPDGSFEAFTAGAYFRLGQGAPHAPLGAAVSGTMPTPPAGAAMSATVGTAAGSVTVDPTGVITASNAHGTITMDAAGNLTATYVAGTLNGPTTINGDVTINGALGVSGDVTISGKSFDGHKHGNGNDGEETTAPI
jgi:phage baseplate assembly protein gpV